ncbi:DUF6339 family protein [Alkalihalobacillus sp. CinArs1]|uniref:DUF6339 family protein n=1 Tax=Alkalihalobacillus sp. CinArs1 TaxID=2995314 RepID=UPI0022DD4CA3|nr:DUF6339 family protein [Alkalihalobacillus sp. CinArs1]
MEVRLLANGYKNSETLYQDFLDGKLIEKDEYFSNDFVFVKEAPDFPFYMGKGSEEEKKQGFLKAFKVISQSYLDMDRAHLLDETFWHSLLLTQKRDFILNSYSDVQNGKNVFNNIVLKKFDWENYIYKIILGAQYVVDNIQDDNERNRYYGLIAENLDLYNYIIKYEIFRNDKFLINILSIIDELDLSKVLKAKIKGREDLGDDERVGRRVIFEFNKSYPVIMSPMLEKDELKKLFVEYLSYYHEVSEQEVSFKGVDGESYKNAESVQVDKYDPYEVENNYYEPVGLSGKDNQANAFVNEDFVSVSSVTSTQVKEPSKPSVESDTEEKDLLIEYLQKHDLEYIDKRHKGGSIWVIGDKRIGSILKPLENLGMYFRYKAVGGRTSRFRSAWFWYEK